VRDVLYMSDLIHAYDAFIKSDLPYGVFNIGGGAKNIMSLLELLKILEDLTGKRSKITFSDWSRTYQKVYISNLSKVKKELKWEPRINSEEGMKKLIAWIKEKKDFF